MEQTSAEDIADNNENNPIKNFSIFEDDLHNKRAGEPNISQKDLHASNRYSRGS